MDALPTSPWATALYALLLTGTAYTAYTLLTRPPFPPGAPPLFEAYPLVGALRFFSRRDAFLRDVAAKSKSGQASFYWGKLRIVALSGEDGRRTFFESRELDFAEGYATLFNAAPKVPDEERNRSGALIMKSIGRFLRRDSLAALVPLLTSDTRALITRLTHHPASSPAGLFNPFDDVYALVYRLTMRTVGCREIAEDEALLARTLRIFEGMDAVSAGWGLLFPWVPAGGQVRRVYAGVRMYMIFKGIAEKREKEGRREENPLQVLIDQGLGPVDIVSVVVASLFAGLVNTGITAAWLLCFLAENPEWLAAVRSEVDTAVERHRMGQPQEPADVLAGLSLEDWEAEFPLIDVCFRETIRLVMTGCALRKNSSGKDVEIGASGEVIPDGAFAVYLIDDIQMNPEVYTDPLRWDPGRYAPDRAEDKRVPHGYIGWGSGRHPCLGMRFAKLEVSVVIALFVASFNFSLVDDKRRPARTSSESLDRSKHQASGPTHPLRIKYEVRNAA